jgi:hypothetical protein
MNSSATGLSPSYPFWRNITDTKRAWTAAYIDGGRATSAAGPRDEGCSNEE